MIDSHYRAIFQRWCVDPIACRLTFHPTTVTGLSLFFGLVAAALIALGFSFSGVFFLALSGYCDVLDGTLARKRQMISDSGAILDLVGDRLVEFAMVFALFLVDREGRSLASLVMFGSMYLCIASFFSVSIFSKGISEKSFVYSPGLIERTETFIVFGVMALLPNYFIPVAYSYAVAVFLTSGVRLWEFFARALRERQSQADRGQ